MAAIPDATDTLPCWYEVDWYDVCATRSTGSSTCWWGVQKYTVNKRRRREPDPPCSKSTPLRTRAPLPECILRRAELACSRSGILSRRKAGNAGIRVSHGCTHGSCRRHRRDDGAGTHNFRRAA